MRYLTANDVIRVNEGEVGPNLLVDFGLLESAVLRPQQSVMGEDAYPDLASKAASLMESLIRNHPFLDGNKRTAVLAIVVLYNLNGVDIIASQEDMVELAVDVAEGRADVKTIAGRLSEWSRPLV